MNKSMTLTALFLTVVASTSFAADTVSVPVKGLPRPFSVGVSVYSHDGLQRVDGCTDGKLRVYNSADQSLVKEIAFGGSWIADLRYSYDNTALFAKRGDSTMAFVNIAAGTVSNYAIPKATAYNAIAYSVDGQKIISFNPKDSSFSVCVLASAACLSCLTGLRGRVSKTGVLFTPDGSGILAVIPGDSSAQLRMVTNDSILHIYKLPGQAVPMASFSPDSKKFIVPIYSGTLGVQNSIVLIDVETGAVIRTILAQTSDRWILLSWNTNNKEMAFSRDGAKILVQDNDAIAAWDAATGNRIFAIENIDANTFDGWFTADGLSVISHTGLTGQYLDSIIRWDLSPYKKTVLSVKQDRPKIQASGFSANGDDLYIGSYAYSEMTTYVGFMQWDSTVFWNGKTGREFEHREYVRQDPAYDYLSGWIFTPDGKRLIEKHATYHASAFSTNDVSVYTITDTCGKSSGWYGGRSAVSQDKRFVYLFHDSSYTILNVYTLDTVTKAFTLPYGWEPLAVHPQKNLVCAFKTTQKDQFSNIYVTMGIWDLGYDSSKIQFNGASYNWIDHDNIDLAAEFMPDGAQIIIHFGGTNDIGLYNVQTGKRDVSYPVTNPINFTLTPDGKMALVGINSSSKDSGICCFNAATGELLRYYKTYFRGTYYFSNAFSFNPANPRQFITGNTIWELPWAIPIKTPVNKNFRTPFRVFAASPNRVSIFMPAKNVTACFALYQPDGREVASYSLPKSGQSRLSLTLPGLAHGMYLYRFEIAGNAFRAQGSLLVP